MPDVVLACLHWVAQVRSQCTVGLELTRLVVHGLRKFSGCDSVVGEGLGRQAAQDRVRSIFVLVAPPPSSAGLVRPECMILRKSAAAHFAAAHKRAISQLSWEDAHRDPPATRDIPMATTMIHHALSAPEAERASLLETVRIYWVMAGAAFRCAASVESGYRPPERDLRLLGIEGIMPLTEQIGR